MLNINQRFIYYTCIEEDNNEFILFYNKDVLQLKVHKFRIRKVIYFNYDKGKKKKSLCFTVKVDDSQPSSMEYYLLYYNFINIYIYI
jgi:hypothetical protein